MRLHLLTAAVLFGLTAPALCQEAPKGSGPQPGQPLPGPFHPFNATGKKRDAFHCLVCRHGLNPTVMIFTPANEPNEAFLKLTQELEKLTEKHHKARLGAFVVFLSDDVLKDETREARTAQLRDWASKAKLKEDVVVFSLARADGPAGYRLAPGNTTVILYDNLKVAANHTFTAPLTDKDVAKVLADVAKIVPQPK